MNGLQETRDGRPWPAPGDGESPEDRTARRTTPAARPAQRCVVGDRVDVLDFFLTNQSALRPCHFGELRAIARRISASLTTPAPMSRILIVGHTDTNRTGAFNQGLGSRRATRAQ